MLEAEDYKKILDELKEDLSLSYVRALDNQRNAQASGLTDIANECERHMNIYLKIIKRIESDIQRTERIKQTGSDRLEA